MCFGAAVDPVVVVSLSQAAASLLLASLEKEKELLRIFLRVSQMENAVLRRMNLNSFLMVRFPMLLNWDELCLTNC